MGLLRDGLRATRSTSFVLLAFAAGPNGSRGLLRRLSRKGFMGASAAAAAGLLGGPNALGKQKEPTNPRKRAALRARRERTVVEHAHTENIRRFDDTLDTFAHARYELISTGDVFDGRRQVDQYYTDLSATFPDQRNANMVLRHADAAVIAEFHLRGTMRGPLEGIPPTGKSFKVRVAAFFLFEPGGTKLVCERVYFDVYSLLQQIGVLEVVANSGLKLPAGSGIPIDRNEPGVKPVKT
jgi:steroid delta-isomerase-like uncharacterized protein